MPGALVAALALSGSTMAAPTGQITEFPTATANAGPEGIVAGADGSLWYAEAGNKIAEVNPLTGASSEFDVPTAGSFPLGIGVGPDGNIWFTEKDTAGTTPRIGFINPGTGIPSDFAIAASSQPNAIAAGPDGSLWVTESAAGVSKVGLVNTTTHTVTEFAATPSSQPTVIVPGPDGNMWFTENGNPGHVGEINPVTHDVTELATPTTNSGPVGIAAGADGNLWFTETGVSKIGRAGAGVPAAAATPPAVTGTPQPGNTLTCQSATWSTWAGQQPGFEFGFDGYRWLLDERQIAGATAQTLALPGSDVGHHVSCQEIATYPLVAATVSASSPSITVSRSLGASLVATSTTPTTLSLTISCQGLPTQTCSGRALLTSRVTTQGHHILAVATKRTPKPKPPKKVTKVQSVASGSYSVATGKTATVRLSLNATGKKLLTARYKVPATLTLTGTASAKKTVTFRYGVLSLSPSYTWAFAKNYSYAIELSISRLPRRAKVTLSCHGHGCPFSVKTFAAPKNGRLALASALKKRHLQPGTRVQIQIAARNEVSEIVVFTIVSGKSPKESFLCLPPGARTPSACVS